MRALVKTAHAPAAAPATWQPSVAECSGGKACVSAVRRRFVRAAAVSSRRLGSIPCFTCSPPRPARRRWRLRACGPPESRIGRAADFGIRRNARYNVADNANSGSLSVRCRIRSNCHCRGQQISAVARPNNRTGARNLRHKGPVLSIAIGVAVAAAGVVLLLRFYRLRPRLASIQGAVIRSSEDPPKRQPIGGVIVTASRGVVSAATQTDASGYFRITFPEVIWPGQTVRLSFRHPDYRPLDMNLTMEFRSTSRRLIVASMTPRAAPAKTVAEAPMQTVSNIRIRYTVNTENEENIGSAVKTFEVVNRGNVPCRHQGPCSPDGEWKAATASVTLDAGPGNEFRNVRASCIAGPCPFTRIQTHAAAEGGRMIVATATDWSDTATFLLEAEVFRT